MNMKWLKIITVILTCTLCLQFVSCRDKGNPKLADNKTIFCQKWDESTLELIDKEKVFDNLATEYPSDLDLEAHPDLIDIDSFTGPFLFVYHPDAVLTIANKAYIPDMAQAEYLRHPSLDSGCSLEVCVSTADRLPDECLSDDKLTNIQSGEIPIMYAVMECTGYGDSTTYHYPSGATETAYVLTWRVAFYSYPDCKLIAWENADRPYNMPESTFDDNLARDMNGNKMFQYDKDGSRVYPYAITFDILRGDN